MCPNMPILRFLGEVVTRGERFDWSVSRQYLLFKLILQGVILTLSLAILAQIFGSFIGLLLYFLRRARLAPLRWLANTYIWFFRGTPLLLQILLFYTIIPYLGLLGPLSSLNFFPALGFTRVPMDSFVAALVALSLNEGAYMAEIVRAGIDDIDVGQLVAAKSLCMTTYNTLSH